MILILALLLLVPPAQGQAIIALVSVDLPP